MDKIAKAMKLMAKAMDLLEQAKNEQPAIQLDKGPKPASGAKGVVQDKRTGKWGARVWRDGQSVWLGTFSSHLEARQAVHDAEYIIEMERVPSTLPHLKSKECG